MVQQTKIMKNDLKKEQKIAKKTNAEGPKNAFQTMRSLKNIQNKRTMLRNKGPAY